MVHYYTKNDYDSATPYRACESASNNNNRFVRNFSISIADSKRNGRNGNNGITAAAEISRKPLR